MGVEIISQPKVGAGSKHMKDLLIPTSIVADAIASVYLLTALCQILLAWGLTPSADAMTLFIGGRMAVK